MRNNYAVADIQRQTVVGQYQIKYQYRCRWCEYVWEEVRDISKKLPEGYTFMCPKCNPSMNWDDKCPL